MDQLTATALGAAAIGALVAVGMSLWLNVRANRQNLLANRETARATMVAIESMRASQHSYLDSTEQFLRLAQSLQERIAATESVRQNTRDPALESLEINVAAARQASEELIQAFRASAARSQTDPMAPSDVEQRGAQSRLDAFRVVSNEFAHSIKSPLLSMDIQLKRMRRFQSSSDGGELPLVVERLQAILESMRDIVRSGAGLLPGLRQEFSVLALVDRAVRIAQDAAGSSAEVRVTTEGDQSVVSYPSNLLIALLELLTNAFESMTPDDAVRISASANPEVGLALIVANTGVGIPPEVRDRVFSETYTTKGPGRGLGLAQARRCMRAIGGEMTLEPFDGKETIFRLTVPLEKNNGE